MGASTAPIRSRVKCGQAGAQCSAGPEDSVSRPRLRVMTEWEAAGDHTWQPRATLWAAGVQGAPHAVAAATPVPRTYLGGPPASAAAASASARGPCPPDGGAVPCHLSG